jgi:hypothetical protein
MSRSTDNEPLRLEENNHLLASYDYPIHMHRPEGTAFRRYEGVEDADMELGSVTLPLIDMQRSNSHEEEFFTGIPNPIHSPYSGLQQSASHIFYDFRQWINGPQPPRSFKIRPVLSRIQNAPMAFLHNHFPELYQRFWLLLIICFLWVSLFSGILSTSLSGCQVFGYGTPVRLSCDSRFW